AARAQGAAKPAGEAPAAKPAPVKKEPAAKPAPAAAAAKASPKPAPAVPAGPKDTGSILAEAGSGAKPGPMTKAEAAAKAPAAKGPTKPEKPRVVVPPMPPKPEYAKPKPKAAPAESRRGFLSLMIGSFLAIGFTCNALVYTLWT